MKSFAKDLSKIMSFPEEGIYSTVLQKAPTANHTLMCLAKGTDISTHTSSREATVVVLKGKGVFVLGRKRIPMAPGVFIAMPKNAPHSLSASTDLAMILSLFGKK